MTAAQWSLLYLAAGAAVMAILWHWKLESGIRNLINDPILEGTHRIGVAITILVALVIAIGIWPVQLILALRLARKRHD